MEGSNSNRDYTNINRNDPNSNKGHPNSIKKNTNNNREQTNSNRNHPKYNREHQINLMEHLKNHPAWNLFSYPKLNKDIFMKLSKKAPAMETPSLLAPTQSAIIWAILSH